MSGISRERNIGAEIQGAGKVAAGELLLGARAAGTFNGTAVDRAPGGGKSLPLSCKLRHKSGVTTGAPTSFTLDTKIQDSADNSTFADYVPASGTAALTQITAASTYGEKDIDLSKARRYIRVVQVVAFVGGTTPTLEAVGDIVMSAGQELPY